MTNAERYKKYVKEYCSNCKNRKTDLCEIRIFAVDKTIYTKCINYERNDKIK